MRQSWNLSGRTALATLAGLAMLEGTTGPAWAGIDRSEAAPIPAAQAAVQTADAAAGSANSTRVISSNTLAPGALAALLEKSVPQLKCSVRQKGVVITGSSMDLARANEVVRIADLAGGFPTVTRLYSLKYINPQSAVALFDPRLQIPSSTPSKSQGASSPGTQTGQTTASGRSPTQDSPPLPGLPTVKDSFPHLAVSAAPEPLAPGKPSFKPLSVDSPRSLNASAGSDSATRSAGGATTGEADASTGSGTSSRVSLKARTLILTGPEDEVNQAMVLLEQLDVAPQQVMIEARVVESSPEALKNMGLEWDFGKFSIAGAGSTELEIGQVRNSGFNFAATINALIQNTKARVLAEPKIAVIDGEDASIFIGDTIRYRVLTSVSDGGQQFFTVDEVPVGIVLLVRPRVNTDGMITLKVNPIVSSVTAFVGPEGLPQTASREANSTIRVHDGDTIAIGGLIQDQDRQTVSKVPILGDLPIVGQLFRNKNHDRKRTDVTIFLTTHLLKG
jgi:type II secretory pathway component GspD/PulD (secretin)